MGENLSKDDQQALELFPWTAQECKERMEEINGYIKDVSFTHPPHARTSCGLPDLHGKPSKHSFFERVFLKQKILGPKFNTYIFFSRAPSLSSKKNTWL